MARTSTGVPACPEGLCRRVAGQTGSGCGYDVGGLARTRVLATDRGSDGSGSWLIRGRRSP